MSAKSVKKRLATTADELWDRAVTTLRSSVLNEDDLQLIYFAGRIDQLIDEYNEGQLQDSYFVTSGQEVLAIIDNLLEPVGRI